MNLVGRIVIIIVAVIVGIGLIGLIAIYVQNAKPKISLGLVDGRLQEIPNKDNAVSTQTKIEDKRIVALPFKENLKTSVNAMKEALSSYGGIVVIEEKDTYIYAVATTGKMKFHDDIEILFDEEEGVIHYRSASRAGYSDMGLNRARYEALEKYYSAN